jgi:nitrite reductase/ring-hydroxylating ferredoxin subunit
VAAKFIEDVPLPFATRGAVRFENQAQFHPRDYLAGLAARVAGDGSFIFDETHVAAIREGEPCVVECDSGSLTAGAVHGHERSHRRISIAAHPAKERSSVFGDCDGKLHAISPICTHMKCDVAWNDAERSWDCPCHGSRFSVDGEVLNGPAREPLERVDVEE